ncbi:MAG: glycoside hydrolase family 16 protein [Bacilli bacterium]|nr:glycoside hydrolase family 16 protein [Bacilli bacterium]MBN2877855.1 glycoside hydrolase family 16 protein [Bacilli bacterium]
MKKLMKHYDFTKMDHLPESDFNIQVGEKWANNELQKYTDNPKNLFFQNGLVIRATYENGIYESARINTRSKFFFQYGRVEIIAKVPSGKGTWPALWMMSEEQRYGHWPKSGEIDIMEHVGKEVDRVFLCLHTETYNHTNKEQYYFETVIPNATKEFHTYAIDWDEDSITYYIDGTEMIRYDKNDKEDQTHKGWPFDQSFFLIMNLAIGGKFGGPVDPTVFPQDFIIKDVKVYQ